MYELQRSVPIPPAIRSSSPVRRKYPFEDMKVGDMFFVEGKTKNTLGTHVSTVSKQLNRRYATRLTYMRKNARDEWVLCKADDEGAVQGVGVWRME